jgi:hypothetical protein
MVANMKRSARAMLVALALILTPLIALPAPSAAAKATGQTTNTAVSFIPPGCAINDNLAATALDFIGRCRIGRILREFPGEYYDATLAQIKVDRSTAGKKAWKLLNDNRFAKP